MIRDHDIDSQMLSKNSSAELLRSINFKFLGQGDLGDLSYSYFCEFVI